MGPGAWTELLRDGFSFISERFRNHAPVDDASEPYRAACHNSLTVDRLRPPPSSSRGVSAAPFNSKDYELIWRDGPCEYITSDGFQSISSLLRAWKDDLEAGNITRCQDAVPIIRRFDDGCRSETRLSAVTHNLMLERYGYNTEQAWQDAVELFLRAIEATETWVSVFYAPESFDVVKSQGVVPYEELGASLRQYWNDSCGLCEVGDFLAFAILQADQWGHPGMRLAQFSLMKMLVDLEAFHRQQPILSFVRVEKEERPPGYLYDDDDDGTLEPLTATQLRDIWHHGMDEYSKPGHGLSRRPYCHIEDEGNVLWSQDAVRRAKIMSAAADSIKAARRPIDGSQSLRIPHSQSLLYAKYRRSSDASTSYKRETWHGVRNYQISAKRGAIGVPPDPRLSKRGRFEVYRTRFMKGQQAEEAVAAASIPLPPSPAATELSSDEDRGAAAAATQERQGHQLTWPIDFAENEDENAPRLRISTAKAAELRRLVEQRHAAQEAARLKREAEARRKEEERRQKEEEERLASSGLRPPARHVISRLSESWHARVNAVIRADPSRDVARSPEGTALKSKDFRTVVSKSEWLNDEIVNGFLLHLTNYINAKAGITNPKTQTPRCHAFTSFFWKLLSTKGAAGTERWMKRVGVTRDNFLNIETILIPICEHNHWTLVVVRPRRSSVTHMDSLGKHGAGRQAVTSIAMRWVKDLLKDKYSDKWRVQHYNSPHQTNGWDCGVHTITNALFLSLGLDPAFYSASEMPLQRDRIAATLINGGFSDDLDLLGL